MKAASQREAATKDESTGIARRIAKLRRMRRITGTGVIFPPGLSAAADLGRCRAPLQCCGGSAAVLIDIKPHPVGPTTIWTPNGSFSA